MPRLDRLDAIERIDAWIDREVADHPDFGVQDLDDHVLTLCRAFDLPEDLGRRFRDLPRAPVEEGEEAWAYNFEPKPDPQRRDTG